MTLLYGGAKGGGKSVFGCYWVFYTLLQIIKKFNLKPSKFPVPVAFMGRKQSVDFSDTTLESWKQLIAEDDYELRSSDKEIIVKDTLKIQYGGFDDSDTVKKFNSAEYAIAFIDQAEEISRDDYGLIKGTLRRKINNFPLDYKILLTANPAVCWLKDEFITQLKTGNAFIQALPSDNSFLPNTYIQTLRDAFSHRPELLAAYVDGNWDVMAGNDIVIRPMWIKNSIEREPRLDDKRVVVACDPARFGDNETVIYVMRGFKIIHQMIYGQRSTMETAGELVALKNKFQARLIAIDSIGIGGGIVDRLAELREPVLAVNSGQRPDTEDAQARYLNLRSQMTWEAGEHFAKEEVSIPNDQTLVNQLGQYTYEMKSSGKIKIGDKDEIKEKLGGKSPDRADALMIGIYAIKKVPILETDYHRINITPSRQNSYGWGNTQEHSYAR
jgi:PBSX family phage terminase large subunit